MAAEHFCELVYELHGRKVNVTQLEQQANLRKYSMATFFKDSTHLKRMPTSETVYEMARALGCPPSQVTLRFAMDVNLPLDPPSSMSKDEEQLLWTVRQLPPFERETVLAIARDLWRRDQERRRK